MNDVNILKNSGVDLDKSLELLEDMETYDEILSEFLKNIPAKLSDLKNYSDSSDMENYSRVVHSLKSDARYLGFTKLASLALEHEMESKDNNRVYVQGHINDLFEETDKMISIAKQYLVNSPVSVEEENNTSKEATILVVDDSDLIRSFIYKIFNNQYEVIMADDGKSAIEIINADSNNKIKAVFLDLNMPNVNGFGVLEYFKENHLFDKYPVSIITGVDDKESIEHAFKYTIVDMLQKPFTEKDVKRIVERTISHSK